MSRALSLFAIAAAIVFAARPVDARQISLPQVNNAAWCSATDRARVISDATEFALIQGLRASQDENPDVRLLDAAEEQFAAGRFWQALSLLMTVRTNAEQSRQTELATAAKAMLANTYLALQQSPEHERFAQEALADATVAGHSRLKAAALLSLGNYYVWRGNIGDALSHYDSALAAARDDLDADVRALALGNSARAAVVENHDSRISRLNDATDAVRRLGNHPRSAEFLVHIATSWILAKSTFDSQSAAQAEREAIRLLHAAIDKKPGREAAVSRAFALTYLVLLERNPEVALSLARRAVFAANESRHLEAGYRAYAHLARLLAEKDAQEPERPVSTQTLAAFEQAILRLASLRPGFNVTFPVATPPARNTGLDFSRTPYLDQLQALVFGYTSLVLRRAASEPARKQYWLNAAINAIERLRTAEVRNYFRDDCSEIVQRQRVPITFASGTTLIYPVVLPDDLSQANGKEVRTPRSVVFVYNATTRAHGIEVVPLTVSFDTLNQLAVSFRSAVEGSALSGADDRPEGLALYDALLRPLEPHISGFGSGPASNCTLVISPDGLLRTIPYAALHDGNNYLIDRCATAVIPSMTLLDPARSLSRDKPRALIAGLDAEVGSPQELNAIAKEMPGAVVLSADHFTEDTLKSALQRGNFSVVHLSTHAKFEAGSAVLRMGDADVPLDTFASMLNMVRFLERPIELLTLSACQTTLGDEKSALGLSGAAFRSGARSVIGALWHIENRSTAEAAPELYKQLGSEGVTRAEALRRFQLKIRQSHAAPYYWAGFWLIGHWQ